MKFQHRIKSSLGIKLAIPITVFGLILLIVVLGVEIYAGRAVAKKAHHEHADIIVNTLSIVAEIDASEQSLWRAVSKLSDSHDLQQLCLFSLGSNAGIESQFCAKLGENAFLVLSSQDQVFVQPLLNDLHTHVIAHYEGYYTLARKVHFFDRSQGMRAYIIFLKFDHSHIYKKLALRALLVLSVCLAGLLGLAAALFAAHSRYVLKPINNIIDVIINHKNQRDRGLVKICSNDELGLLARAYNQLTLSNRAREASLQRRTEELRTAKLEADQASRTKSEFLASMSHEIRTPMNGVIGMLSLLEKSQLTSDQRHKFRLAKSSAESLLTLINDILDFSKIEAGKLELENISFDLCGVLGELAEAMAVRAEESDLVLDLDLTEVRHAQVKGDPSRIRQIFTNLIGNAIKFTYSGQVLIRAALIEQNDTLVLQASVQDSGIGIAADKLECLFDSFTQDDASTTRKYGGTGLGLTICRLLCLSMGGGIEIESKLGRGSRFHFNIVLNTSENSKRILPRGDLHLLCIVIIASPNIDTLNSEHSIKSQSSIVRQLQDWGISTYYLERPQALLGLIDELNTKQDVTLSIFVDYKLAKCFSGEFVAHLKDLGLHIPAKLIFMHSIGENMDEDGLAQKGYWHGFPLPATKQDLLFSIELLTGAVKPEDVNSRYLVNEEEFGGQAEAATKRILLVEDNLINQELAMGLLEDMQIEADIAGNGLEAIKALYTHRKTRRYDLILMDCQMPDMDGFECTRLIRQGEAGSEYEAIPIIALTANAMVGDRERCLSVGMNDYLSKPIDFDALARVVFKWNTWVHDSALSPDLPRIKHLQQWDRESALARVRGKKSRLHQLVKRFLNELPLDIERLEQAVYRGKYEETKNIAHTIKGAAGNLSALQLMDIASGIETVAGNKGEQVLISGLFEQMQAEFSSLQQVLVTFIDKAGE